MSIGLFIILAIICGIRYLILKRIELHCPMATKKTKNHLVNCVSTDFILCALISFLISKVGGYVFKIDSFRSLRTWLPFLGDDMAVVDLVDDYIDIPEVERSEGMQNLINTYGSVSQLASICLWGSRICGLLVYLLIKAKRGKSIVRLSVFIEHFFLILIFYCAFKFYNAFSDYLWGLGGTINYLFLLIPALIAAYDIFRLSTTLDDNGVAFADLWYFEGKISSSPGKKDKATEISTPAVSPHHGKLAGSSELKELFDAGILTQEEYQAQLKLMEDTTEQPIGLKQLLDNGVLTQQEYDKLTNGID